ncbi:hypothetical protein [Cellulomonas triticagri]|uniref:FtsX-like permease family protein n=1 Tax=Cellulomonas triticagri TaxID=2483352 RepID=A0A3M2JMY4_9CELL|nr:hypothetical protein [Cellulomonas triticagri]RMI12953.1 hypothetical protein EBM89_06330 [Cellulomonas triticagri]
MTVTYLRLAWGERAVLAPVFVVLLFGALVVAALATLVVVLGDAGDIGSLVTLGSIALVCTAVVLHAVSRHGVGERWATARRLRIVGMSARRLRMLLVAESALLALLASAVAVLLAPAVVLPALVPLLVGQGVIPPGTDVTWRVAAVLATVAGSTVVAVLGTAGAARLLVRGDPVAGGPPGRTGRSRRLLPGVVALLATVAGAALVRVVARTESDETAFLLGFLAVLCLVVVLGCGWDAVVRGAGALRGRVGRRSRSAPALLAARWLRWRHPSTVVVATSIATLLVLYLGGYPAASDDVARARLLEVVGDRWVASSMVADGAVTVAGARGVTLAEGQAVVTSSNDDDADAVRAMSWIALVGGGEARSWVRGLTDAREVPPGPGIVVSRLGAVAGGATVGDEITLGVPGSGQVRLPVVAVADLPLTFGDLLVLGADVPGAATGRVTTLVDRHADVAPDAEVRTATEWVAGLPPGKAVARSGGGGTGETPLLVGAPVLLCLTLAAAATAVTVAGRRADLRVLDRIGMTRAQRVSAVVRGVGVDVLGSGLVAAVLGSGLLALAVRPYAAAVGRDPGIAWVRPAAVLVPLLFTAVCLATAAAVTASVRRGR